MERRSIFSLGAVGAFLSSFSRANSGEVETPKGPLHAISGNDILSRVAHDVAAGIGKRLKSDPYGDVVKIVSANANRVYTGDSPPAFYGVRDVDGDYVALRTVSASGAPTVSAMKLKRSFATAFLTSQEYTSDLLVGPLVGAIQKHARDITSTGSRRIIAFAEHHAPLNGLGVISETAKVDDVSVFVLATFDEAYVHTKLTAVVLYGIAS